MDDFEKHIYILGPNKELNERFIGEMFDEEYKFSPGLFRVSEDMLDPEDAIQVYVLVDGNDEWLMHYSTKRMTNTILVKEF